MDYEEGEKMRIKSVHMKYITIIMKKEREREKKSSK
jgi:hypothetical protein